LFSENTEFVPVQFEVSTVKIENPAPVEPQGEVHETFQSAQYNDGTQSSQAKEKVFSESQTTKPDFFVLPSSLWATIKSDSAFAEELEKVIAQEVEKRVASAVANRLAEVEPVHVAQKQKEGFETGYGEGKKKAEDEYSNLKADLISQVELIKSELHGNLQSFLNEKQSLLMSHQASWLDALSILMKKFLVKNAGQIEAGIQQWLKTEVSNFQSNEKLKLHIPESQFERLEKMEIYLSATEFEFVKDVSLKNNEFRVETKSGGAFFSADVEMKKLDDMLRHISGLEDVQSA
jgi:flagellar biosynthesis/type III secretory pathway protein FliH